MKYGLIVFVNTDNIGDDIQSYAMERFLPHVDYIVPREHLDDFYTPNGEPIAAIFGGWYIHSPNWPPSPFLKYLLPISVHFNRTKYIMDDYGGEWLKKFSPIGCRDNGTLKNLNRFGVEGYLSGCCTLTLEPFDNIPPPHERIVLTDVPESVVEFVREHTKKEIALVSHESAGVTRISDSVVEFVNVKKGMTFGSNSKENVPFKRMSWSQRRILIEELLKFYQEASLVVTSRLHAALPCLALGTPVLLVTDKQKSFRLSTFIPYINNTTPEDLLSGKYQFNFDEPQANPGGHEKFAEIIRKACKDFVATCESINDTSRIDVETWLDGHKKNNRLKRIIMSLEPQDSFLRRFFKWEVKNFK